MRNQIQYYNEFATKHKDSILNSSDPSTWTSDMKNEGPIYNKMKKRINEQKKFILKYFTKAEKVLDLGCGFGRLSLLMAKNGFEVVGIENSEMFIEIANILIKRHKQKTKLFHTSIIGYYPDEKFDQIILFDVFEHFKIRERRNLLEHIANNLCNEGTKILVTFPAIGQFNTLKKLINFLKYIPFLSSIKLEHPYPIPWRKSFEHICIDLFLIINYQVKEDTAFFVLKRKKNQGKSL